MFRTQQNAFDDVVVKATDENLTSENWALILDVCDKVATSDNGSKDVVSAMIKRMAHRNANVQLYTLELANSLSQNCGIEMHRELASRSFTDALLRLAGDRTTHQQVKSKIVERMEDWTKMFGSNNELGIMEQAYSRLKSQNPNLQPPQAPTKRQITDYDRKKEEEELQMALKLSVQDKSTTSSKPAELPATSSTIAAASTPSAGQSSNAPSQALPSGTTAATVSRVRALYDFVPSEPGELQFRKGDVIAVLESVYKDWWKGSLRGQTGIFPLNYVEKLSDPTQDELQKEAQMEAEVFGQIKNVERLLALLSTNAGDISVRDNEEITELYNGTLAIRPKLIALIGKYSQKKDDFQQLNEKFIKARRDYEALLESSMAQSAQQYSRAGQPPYGYPGGMPPQGYPAPQRFFPPDGLPPNVRGQEPPQFAPQPSATQSFQAPYPIGSPPPPSHTPGPYPAQFQPVRRQSYHSEHQQAAPAQYPPQEMNTSAYDSPVDAQNPPRQGSFPPQAPDQTYQQAAYPNHDQHSYPPSQQVPPGVAQSQYPPQNLSSTHLPQSQPSYAPPAPPPERGHSPYPGYPPQQAPGSQQYQAYQPPQQAAGSDGPGGFYR